jgi:uncharacterized membrane protein
MVKNFEATTDDALERFSRKPRAMRFVIARRRLISSIVIGLITLVLWPSSWRPVTRLLASWDITIALDMIFALGVFVTTDRSHIRRNALIQDDGRFAILILIGVASFASLAAIVVLIGGDGRSGAELSFAALTIVLSWAMIHMSFALHYAHDYYRGTKPGGLDFPGGEAPDYWDFVYLAFVIGTTAQTSDVGITDRTIRRTVTAHGLVSFLFNTAFLALMVSIAASAI